MQFAKLMFDFSTVHLPCFLLCEEGGRGVGLFFWIADRLMSRVATKTSKTLNGIAEDEQVSYGLVLGIGFFP